jgi:hypothetical protein
LRIEVQITDTESHYFCDICGEEQKAETWAYGGHCDAGEQLERCDICHKEVCPKCRNGIPSFSTNYDKLCKECLETYNTLLTELKYAVSQGQEKERELRKQLFSHIKINK